MESFDYALFYLRHNPLAQSFSITLWQDNPDPPYSLLALRPTAPYLHTTLTISTEGERYRLNYYFALKPCFFHQRHKRRYDAIARQRRAYIPIGWLPAESYQSVAVRYMLPKRYGYQLCAQDGEHVKLHRALSVAEYHTLRQCFPEESRI